MENENLVRCFFNASNNGVNYKNGFSFQEAMLKDILNIVAVHTKPEYKNLYESICDQEMKPCAVWVKELFEESIYLDFKFAEKLNRYDILDSFCFSYKTDAAKELLEYLNSRDEFCFVVYSKKWEGKDGLRLDFEVANIYTVDKALEMISRGVII